MTDKHTYVVIIETSLPVDPDDMPAFEEILLEGVADFHADTTDNHTVTFCGDLASQTIGKRGRIILVNAPGEEIGQTLTKTVTNSITGPVTGPVTQAGVVHGNVVLGRE